MIHLHKFGQWNYSKTEEEYDPSYGNGGPILTQTVITRTTTCTVCGRKKTKRGI